MPNKKRLPAANTSMYRSANLMCRAVDGQTNRYELAFSSEEPYARWGDVEVLLHEPGAVDPVSYTHLTLPTIYSVEISVGDVTLKKKKRQPKRSNPE